MALNSGLQAVMGTFVGATVFLTGFLSARVHEALRDATQRARQIDDRLVDGGARGESVSVDALGEQREELHRALKDQFASLVIGANVAFTVALVVLAALARAEPGDLGRAATATLVAFVGAGFVILSIGCLDVLWVR